MKPVALRDDMILLIGLAFAAVLCFDDALVEILIQLTNRHAVVRIISNIGVFVRVNAVIE